MKSLTRARTLSSVAMALADADREIERLEAELDAKRAVRIQLLQEQRLVGLFPLNSGFMRQP